MAQLSNYFETVVDVITFVGLAAFLWSVANSLRMIAQRMSRVNPGS
jgi:hypothetical protein